MSYQISGTITAPQENRSHTEPTEPVDGGVHAAGSSFRVDCGTYTNTGNVDQTVSVAATATENCTVELFFNGGESTATLTPAQGVDLQANVTVSSEAVGAADAPYSFEVDSTWS